MARHRLGPVGLRLWAAAILSQYIGLISTNVQSLPMAAHTLADVPVPPNGSRTECPGWVESFMQRSTNPSWS